MKRRLLLSLVSAAAAVVWAQSTPAGEASDNVLTINFSTEGGPVSPRIGFLHGPTDSTPCEALLPTNIPLLWIGHQYQSQPTDWSAYEADVKTFLQQYHSYTNAYLL
jgi:hypothetical protein